MEDNMRLSAPKQITFWIAVILAVIGLVAQLGIVAALGGYAFWFVFVGFVVLAAGCFFEGV